MSHSKLYNYVIKDLTFFGYHGIDPKEIKNGQSFSISITYSKKINNNLIYNDNIDHVIDYKQIINKINEVFNNKRYNLLEALANDIHEKLLFSFDIDKLKVKVMKKKPPVSFEVNSISVESND